MNALYGRGKQKFLEGSIHWLTDDFKAVLVSAAYTAQLATHEYLDDLTGVVSTSSNLDGKTSTLGVADCNDITFDDVTGDLCTHLVVYRDTGNAATSPLIVHIDQAIGLPVYPNGGDIVVVVDGGSSKLFAL